MPTEDQPSQEEDQDGPALDISPEKVAFVILKARGFEAEVAPFDDGDRETADEQPDMDGVLEERSDDGELRELVEFMEALNEDEEANLVALAWIGRGTYDAEDWDEALATARSERTSRTARYLLGMPLLADYLEDGLEALGIDVAEVENDLIDE